MFSRFNTSRDAQLMTRVESRGVHIPVGFLLWCVSAQTLTYLNLKTWASPKAFSPPARFYTNSKLARLSLSISSLLFQNKIKTVSGNLYNFFCFSMEKEIFCRWTTESILTPCPPGPAAAHHLPSMEESSRSAGRRITTSSAAQQQYYIQYICFSPSSSYI